MTAAMAFFSIALTLNLTGVRLGALRASDLRPAALSSFVHREFMVASTPLIRYYDHLRFVYEVESRMKELRRARRRAATAQAAAAGGRVKAGSGPQGWRVARGPSAAVGKSGARDFSTDFLETSLKLKALPAHSGGSAVAPRERSTKWTA